MRSIAVLLAIVAIVAITAEARSPARPRPRPAKTAEEAEWDEWAPFVARMEALKIAAATGRKPDFVPDTDWLKTCAGWSAIEMCSTVFGSGLSEELAYEEDVGYIPRSVVTIDVDYDDRSVVVACIINNPQNQTFKAIWRQGIGCTLVEHLTEAQLRAQDLGDQAPRYNDPNVPWPVGDGFFPERIPAGVDVDCIARVAADDFANRITNPRAIVVIYKGELVFEQYGEGVIKDNPLIGWSATKSVTQALLGTLVMDGLVDINRPANIPEWYETPNDPRQNITVDMMLRMSSGTRWIGDIFPTTECVFKSNGNCQDFCGRQPLDDEPNTVWNYNSGSTYLLSRLILETRGDQRWNNFEWPKNKLFRRINANSFYIEYQPNNFFLGGGYGYATARDWARFGLLYERDGVWVDGTRLLPEGWVEYTRTPSHTNEDYGAHFWRMPEVDPEMFYSSGFRNQNVYIFPNRDLVIARLAMPPLIAHPVFRPGPFLNSMLECFPPAAAPK